MRVNPHKLLAENPRRLPICQSFATLHSVMCSQPSPSGRNPHRTGAMFCARRSHTKDTSDKAFCLMTHVIIWVCQVNWQQAGGGSSLKRRRNRDTFQSK